MTVELGQVHRAAIAEEITVVGNLIGDATVSVSPRAAGRLQDVTVRLGDRVTRGQRIAKIEDYELLEQVKQAEAAQEVSQATIRQREAELKLAETNAERSRNLFERQLLPKQTLDDTESDAFRRPRRSSIWRGRSNPVQGAPRRTADHSRQHHHHLPGQRLRRQARGRSGRLRVAERAGRGRRRHLARPAGGQRRREGPEAAADGQRHAGRGRRLSRARPSRAASPASRRCSIRRRAPRRSRSRSRTRTSG